MTAKKSKISSWPSKGEAGGLTDADSVSDEIVGVNKGVGEFYAAGRGA